MGFGGYLLKFHGIAEAAAGVAMIAFTEQFFPFLVGQSLELQYLGKCFGVAILSLGITGLLSQPSGGVLFGALVYHSSVTALFVRTLMENITSDPNLTQKACIFHGTCALLFAIAWVNRANTKQKLKAK